MAKTLLQMAGMTPAPARLSDSVLVLIDCQNEYRSGSLPLVGVDSAVKEVGRVLARARDAGTPVIHIAHKGGAGQLFDRDADNGAIMDEVAPLQGEPVIEKPRPNAFYQTNLLDAVKATGRSQLIVAGFMTHMCISTTVRAAIDHGLFSTVVADACATRDLPSGDGGVVPGADLHRAALAGLSDRFAVIVRDGAALG